ncbi:MAG TPA: NAD(P)-dependent alcohol dehydrogenase [Chloroflexota bacterium]
MKAAQIVSYHEPFQITEVPEPRIQGPHDVIVRIGGAGLCRTDLHILEGLWQERVTVTLPYVPGHENAGWVEAVGSDVRAVQVGDPVIVHPVMTDGICPACRRGEDMYCEGLVFPGIDANGGFAQYLRTVERSVLKLPPNLEPAAVAPFADAGLTAYRAAKKAAAHLPPGSRAAIIGIGGLGHIALQVLRALSPVEIVAVDTRPAALELARQLGAAHLVSATDRPVEAVRDLSHGGVEAVLDFVGEGPAVEQAFRMLRKGGTHYVIGYGGELRVPTMDFITGEVSVVGNLVGTFTELRELMALAGQGRVTLRTTRYPLDAINDAVQALEQGRIDGRAVIVP